MELLADLNERDGTTIVAVLHDLGLAARFFPRLVLIDGGRIVADGTPDGGPDADRIRDVFGVDPAIVRRVRRAGRRPRRRRSGATAAERPRPTGPSRFPNAHVVSAAEPARPECASGGSSGMAWVPCRRGRALGHARRRA